MTADRNLPLITTSLLLRQVDRSDADVLFRLSNEPAFRMWLPSQVYADDAHARAALEFLIEQYRGPADPRRGAYVLVVEHRIDRKVIGHVGFSPVEGDVEIGFAMAKEYQRRGLAAEGVIAASDWAIEAFQLDRVLGITASANAASKQTLIRAGFTHRADKQMTFQGTDQMVSVYDRERKRHQP